MQGDGVWLVLGAEGGAEVLRGYLDEDGCYVASMGNCCISAGGQHPWKSRNMKASSGFPKFKCFLCLTPDTDSLMIGFDFAIFIRILRLGDP